MPKPFGEGLKYMQLDVDISDNDKIDILMDEFEHLGFAFWTLIHARIFKNSYYWEQEDRKVNQFCKKILRVPREKYDEMLVFAIKMKVFDRELFESNNILTSKGIQRRYLIITKKWSKVKLISEYILEDVDVYPYQVSFYTKGGRYIGYKLKNSEEIHSEEFVPRKHEAKSVTEENRAEQQSAAVKEYFENIPEVKVEIPVIPDSNNPPVKKINGNHKELVIINPIDFYQDDALSKEVLAEFGMNQLSHSLYHILFGRFMTELEKNKKIDEFRIQFRAWRDLRQLIGEQYFLFGFHNYLGDPNINFEDGKWNSDNWSHRLQIAKKSNNKTNGKENKRSFTQPDSYNQI